MTELLCLACGCIGHYGPHGDFRPTGDEVWCMACGDRLTAAIPVVSGDYDSTASVYVYIGEPSGNVVLFERTDPPHAGGHWRCTDLTGRRSPFGLARQGAVPIRPDDVPR